MDLYEEKIFEMHKYIPFLKKMISKLEYVQDPSKNPQLVKMKSLLNILTDKSKKLRYETLLKCEDVLKKLYLKVEGSFNMLPKNDCRTRTYPPYFKEHRQTSTPYYSQTVSNKLRWNSGQFPRRWPRGDSKSVRKSYWEASGQITHNQSSFDNNSRHSNFIRNAQIQRSLSTYRSSHNLKQQQSQEPFSKKVVSQLDTPLSPTILETPMSPPTTHDNLPKLMPRVIPLERKIESNLLDDKGCRRSRWDIQDLPSIPSQNNYATFPCRSESQGKLHFNSIKSEPLTYGEYRKLRLETVLQKVKMEGCSQDGGTTIPKESKNKVVVVKVPNTEILIHSPKLEKHDDSDELSDSESESLQIDEGDTNEKLQSQSDEIESMIKKSKRHDNVTNENDNTPKSKSKSRKDRNLSTVEHSDQKFEENHDEQNNFSLNITNSKPWFSLNNEKPLRKTSVVQSQKNSDKNVGPDVSVFLGSLDSFSTRQFETKFPHFDSKKCLEIKSRLSSVHSLHEKVQNFKVKNNLKVKIKTTSIKEKSFDPISQTIVTTNPSYYFEKMHSMVNKLKSSISYDVAQHQENNEDFLYFIKFLKKKRIEVPLIKLTQTAVNKLEKRGNVKSLFKCGIGNCSYSTNSIVKYKSHLSEKNNMGKEIVCMYCLKSFISTDKLINHIISQHGVCLYQCPYCVHRCSSKLSMLIHQQYQHHNEKKGFITCKNIKGMLDQVPSYRPSNISCCLCPAFSTSDPITMIKHKFSKHLDIKLSYQFNCNNCKRAFLNILDLFVHHTLEHDNNTINAAILQFEILKDVVNDNCKDGFNGKHLYRCGNNNCFFSSKNITQFKEHLLACEFSIDSVYLTCYHCQKQLKHIQTLLDHLKTHEIKFYFCSLCDYKISSFLQMKNHLKHSHKVTNTKLFSVDSLNQDCDNFIVMPRNAYQRNEIKKQNKHVFSPEEVSKIPKMSVFRYLLRCSLCDFVTKVRQNMVKHLILHKKGNALNLMTPINPPPHTDSLNFQNMGIINKDNKMEPITDTDMAAMPALIPENGRYKCCSSDCSYVTIDEVMLTYHIQTFHSEFKDNYACPHCIGVDVNYENLDFHLRCHGELLYKCQYCMYYHWQKRTAEKHSLETHGKPFVHNVRMYKDQIDEERKKNIPTDLEKETVEVEVLPYKCGLCDYSYDTLEGIKYHVRDFHGLINQFICGFCKAGTDSAQDFELHQKSCCKSKNLYMINAFYVEQSSAKDPNYLNVRMPLWKRDMPGLKHIRGILYDNDEKETNISAEPLTGYNVNNLKFSATCKKCGIKKKTVKGLKLHIKVAHLKSNRYRCNYCSFSVNAFSHFKNHFKKSHPSSKIDFELINDKNQSYSQEYWEDVWGVPKNQLKNTFKVNEDESYQSENQNKKRGKKKPENGMSLKECSNNSPEKLNSKELTRITETSIHEISPFEHMPTFKCQYCPKRTQSLLQIERHLSVDHPNQTSGHRLLTRDEVVDLITAKKDSSDYSCYFCEESGSIIQLQKHFHTFHPDESLKVKKLLKSVNGYLECQMCGYLSPGFDRFEQKVHFHEEHPQETIKVHKYILKNRSMSRVNIDMSESKKLDINKYNGILLCPKSECKFETQSISAINSHLRKHTQTFKCGHCGVTYENSSEFHKHSAMAHGDKIPDLVKDPKAEAEFDALRGLLLASLKNKKEFKHSSNKMSIAKKSSKLSKKRQTARKSTSKNGDFFYGGKINEICLNSTLNKTKYINLIPILKIWDCLKP